ncbi:MAG TPA: multiheme c-type cytochrome [Pirellulales bacterium]|nr:multiheme c-type cytochrome [Pirellulales bacterium]
MRIALGALCCVAFALLIALGGGSHREASRPQNDASRLNCRECHQQVWDEWEGSYHARSFSEANVQASFAHFGFDRKCQSCHAPQRRMIADASQPVVLREEDVGTGVDCLCCHGLPTGVAATRSLPGAPCRPIRTAELTTRSCAACHVAIYKDWAESRYAREEKSCESCHMPAVAERANGRSHVCAGGHDPDLIRSGVKMACRREGTELVVEATNHATGHNFPGERHNRVLYLQVIERTPSGEIKLARQELIKGITPFRGESSEEKIRADDSFEARFPIVEPPVVAEVQLCYKSFPWYPDRDALVVARAEVELEAE